MYYTGDDGGVIDEKKVDPSTLCVDWRSSLLVLMFCGGRWEMLSDAGEASSSSCRLALIFFYKKSTTSESPSPRGMSAWKT